MKKTFVEELNFAKQNGCAVGAFNIFNHLSARAVVQAASELNDAVILQTSVVTVKEFGTAQLGAMLRQLAEDAPVNVLIHLDHCQDLALAKECVDCGWDSVMYDGSRLPIEENIANCREIVAYAHRKGVQVEGELGRIVGVEDDIVVDEKKAVETCVEEAIHFVKESGIDAFAPAIGTAHGVYKGTPKINYELMEQLRGVIEAPVVIHGGTGLSDETFIRLIELGGAKVNVSTAIKHGYIDGCKAYLAEYPDKVNPIHFDQFLNENIKKVAVRHMNIFKKRI